MDFLYNNPKLKKRRQELRKNQTDCERRLWNLLRSKKCRGYKFYRQYSIGYYILDFYCPTLKLSIELDGGQHAEKQKEYDEARTAYIKEQGIKELRFWNNEILENIDGVYARILEYCPLQ